jgi:glycosyltransferase involved in cell wall biosynthesis
MTDTAGGRLCIVTTNFNYGAYLDDCMRSVVQARGFERVDYVVMDGGSTDNSVEIIRGHEGKLAHWQSAKDEGMYHAIEQGFAKSDAPYMGWLNSDDQLAAWALQTVLDIFDQLPEVQFITSRFPMQARKDGTVVKTTILAGVDNWGFYNGEHVRTLGLPSTGWIVQDCTFWRRALWASAGACFDHGLKLAADFELWARFMMKTDRYIVPVPLGIYRIQGANKAMVGRDAYRDECVKVLKRYSPVIPTDARKLGERVVAKKLATVGLSHLIDEKSRTAVKTIAFDYDRNRYFAFEER